MGVDALAERESRNYSSNIYCYEAESLSDTSKAVIDFIAKMLDPAVDAFNKIDLFCGYLCDKTGFDRLMASMYQGVKDTPIAYIFK